MIKRYRKHSNSSSRKSHIKKQEKNGRFIIEVHNICKSFLSGTETLTILHNINMQIQPGASIALLGQSGSGKSTFLNLLGGLDQADSGQIICAGQDLKQMTIKDLNHYRQYFVGFIFQHHYMLKDLTVLENIMLPARIAGAKITASKEQALSLLQKVDLSKRKNHMPHMLSGGELQRIAVVRALINRPQCIFADEPTGSLDIENAGIVSDLLFSLCKEYSTTLIIATHDQRLSSFAKFQYCLIDSQIQVIQSPAMNLIPTTSHNHQL